MILLVLALVLFGALQLASARADIKHHAQIMLGKAYGPVFGLASLALFTLVIWAFRSTGKSELYAPPAWGYYANFALTLLGFISFSAAVFRGNLRNMLREPVAIGILLLALGHLLANGDSATLALMFGLALIALWVTALKRKNPAPASDVRAGHDLLSVVFGVAFYSVAVQLHAAVIGVPVFELLK